MADFYVRNHGQSMVELDDEDVENEAAPMFRMPSHLLARLEKRRQKVNEAKTGKADCPDSSRVLQSMENNITPLLRRETFVCHNKLPTKVLADDYKKSIDDLSQQFESDFNKSSLPSKTGSSEFEEEDLRYLNWLNSAIIISFNIENIKTIDLRRLITDVIVSADHQNAVGSTTEVLKDGVSTLAYKEKKLMDTLRRKAQKLYDDQIASVAEALLADINAKKFYIRKDKSIHADVGVKKHILETLLNYNPLWLKIALECVFKTPIEKMPKRSEMHTLLHVLTCKLVSFKDAATKKGARNVVTYFMKEINVEAAKRHILYHFILIVHFLDVAKRARLIDHDPCLFRINAEHKSTRDILVAFSRDYITGVGDITKALRNVGINLVHEQLPIEQYNFTATKLAYDIRDGVRLARLAEFLLQRNDILSKLQFPPDSITRKIHNLEFVFSILRNNYPNCLPSSITARDVASGSRKHTLIILDQLIELYNERQRLLELQQLEEFVLKIQRWYRRHLDCKAQQEHFVKLRTAAIWVQQFWRQKQLMKRERTSFLATKEATIKIQTVARGYLARKYFAHLRQVNTAALVVQRRFRANLQMKLKRECFVKLRAAAILVQQRWRVKKQTAKDRATFLAKREAIIKVQTAARGYLVRKNFARYFEQMTNAALTVQRRFRANRQMRLQREGFLKLRTVTIWVQKRWRAKKQAEADRAAFLSKRKAVIRIQTAARGYLARKSFAHLCQVNAAALVVQRRFRANRLMKEARAQFQLTRRSALSIQQYWRGYQLKKAARAEFLKFRQAAVFIQRKYREKRSANRFFYIVQQYCQLTQWAAITIQKFYRGHCVRKQLYAQVPALPLYRDRVQAANAKASEEQSIRVRMFYIMERISNCKSINSLYKDVETIEFYTDVSKEICQLIISNDWLITVLICATNKLNRSEPHKKVLSNVLSIILHLAQKTNTNLLFGNAEMLQMIIKVIRIFGKTTGSKDKSVVALNVRALTLLSHMMKDEESKNMLKSDQLSFDALMKFIKETTNTPRKSTNTLMKRSGSKVLIEMAVKVQRLMNI